MVAEGADIIDIGGGVIKAGQQGSVYPNEELKG